MARLGFDVRADERRLVASAGAAFACAGAAVALVASAADALFLSRVGPRYLGVMLALSSASLVVVLGMVGALADRRGGAGRGRLLVGLCVVAAAVLAVLAGLVNVAPRAAAAALLLFAKQFASAFDLAFWVLAAERLDARQNRRLVPLFVALQGLGMAAGAFSVAPLAHALGSRGALMCGAGLFAVAGLFARGFASRKGPRALAGPRRREPASMLAVVRQSRLASGLAWIVAVAGVCAPLLYYLLGAAASASFAREADLAAFFGTYRGAVQVVTLAAQLFIAPLVLARAGVAPALLAAPLGAVFTALALGVNDALYMIVTAQATAKVLDAAVQTPAEKLTQNLLDREVRGRVAGFLDGVAKRAGAILGGVLAAALTPWPGMIIAVLAIAALAWLIVSWRMRRGFADMAVAELDHVRPDSLAEIDMLSDARTIDRLRAELVRGAQGGLDRGLVIDLIGQLGQRGRVDAPLELARVARRALDKNTVLSALCTWLEQGQPAGRAENRAVLVEELGALVEAGCEDGADGTSIASTRALGLAVALCGPGAARDRALEVLATVAHQADSPALDLSARVARARAQGHSIDALVDDALDGDVSRHDTRARGAAVRDVAFAELRIDVARGAASPDTALDRLLERTWVLLRAVRRRARTCPDALCAASGLTLDQVVERCASASHSVAEVVLLRSEVRALALAWIADQAPGHMRAAGLTLVGRMAQAADTRRLAAALGHDDEQVRLAAIRGLRRLGARALDVLLETSRYGKRSARSAAFSLLRELRVSSAALDEAIGGEIEQIEIATWHLAVLGRIEHSELLARRLGERIEEAIHALLAMLEARLAAPAVAMIARQIMRTGSGNDTARALEALDTMLPRSLAARVMPVLEGGSVAVRGARAALRLAREHAHDDEDATAAAVHAELAGPDALARALVLHALGTAGRAHHRDAISAAAASAARAADPMEMLRRITGDNVSDKDDAMPRSVESIMTLSQISLFAELTTRQLGALVDVIRWHAAAPGDVIVRQGERGDAMYFVATGSVRVDVDTGGHIRCVGELGPGEPFGEMSLFEDAPRSATVSAREKSRIGRIDRADFETLVDEFPAIALAICRVLSRRVRELNRS